MDFAIDSAGQNKIRRNLVYFGHHRSASTWTCSVLAEIAGHIGMPVKRYPDFDSGSGHTRQLFLDVNAEYAHTEELQNWRGFHVIRDPRDIVISSYFSHLHSHPEGDWLSDHRERLSCVGLDEGIRLSIDFRASQFERMGSWNYEDPRVLECRFEELTGNPHAEWMSVLSHLYIDHFFDDGEKLTDLLAKYSFEKLSGGRQIGEEDLHHHYRLGLSGVWKRHLSEKNRHYFKKRHGHLLIKLGYEEDFDW